MLQYLTNFLYLEPTLYDFKPKFLIAFVFNFYYNNISEQIIFTFFNCQLIIVNSQLTIDIDTNHPITRRIF